MGRYKWTRKYPHCGPSTATFAIGGTISGLSGTLVLQDNGSDPLSLTTNGSFTFGMPLTSGSTFNVTIETQPSAQSCTVAGGTVLGVNQFSNDLWRYDVATDQWSWMSGAQVFSSDAAGRLLLFGGLGEDSTGFSGELNDVWQYSSSAGAWIWLGGSNTADPSGVYGTLGTAAETNAPGGRSSAAFAVDSSGDLWLFGGFGFDSTGNPGQLNDLWTL